MAFQVYGGFSWLNRQKKVLRFYCQNGNGRDVCTLAGTRENWADVLVAFRVMVQCGASFTNWVSVGEASGDH
ncbi:hypothetical protein DY000_02008299 [Brassica cretica]|uniref:Uncharacterized protein n=1 Tax=Brassica cretica TaxID=69181 RepID=A0ABQ7BZM9_BRACR|nr:hypothetical protein DY000_02008299 [Brassica cretica]